VRVVLDTNVLIAAFATRGLCEDVLRVTLAEHELIVSEFILAELERVLLEKLKMPATRARAVAAFLRDTAVVVNPSSPADWPEKDPDDRWIVATALAGEADVLVSGDRDLLDASQESPVDAISPREFWERLR
jgi:putative PIN family toxin of toxin-antitoxin system